MLQQFADNMLRHTRTPRIRRKNAVSQGLVPWQMLGLGRDVQLPERARLGVPRLRLVAALSAKQSNTLPRQLQSIKLRTRPDRGCQRPFRACTRMHHPAPNRTSAQSDELDA